MWEKECTLNEESDSKDNTEFRYKVESLADRIREYRTFKNEDIDAKLIESKGVEVEKTIEEKIKLLKSENQKLWSSIKY